MTLPIQMSVVSPMEQLTAENEQTSALGGDAVYDEEKATFGSGMWIIGVDRIGDYRVNRGGTVSGHNCQCDYCKYVDALINLVILTYGTVQVDFSLVEQRQRNGRMHAMHGNTPPPSPSRGAQHYIISPTFGVLGVYQLEAANQNGGYAAYLQRMWNKLRHALNGNQFRYPARGRRGMAKAFQAQAPARRRRRATRPLVVVAPPPPAAPRATRKKRTRKSRGPPAGYGVTVTGPRNARAGPYSIPMAYPTGRGSIASAVLPVAGAALAESLAPGMGGVGSALGEAASKIGGTIFGSGAYDVMPKYKVESNSLHMAPDVPTFGGGEYGTTIQFREMIMDYDMPSAFTRQTLRIDPTNALVFPWLSGEVVGYQKYRFKGLVLEYIPSSAEAVASTTAGMGLIAVSSRYDVYSAAPGSMQALETTYFSVVFKPSQSALIPIECKPQMMNQNSLKLIEPGESPPDLQPFVHCLVDIGASGAPVPYIGAGQFWAIYSIELLMPRTDSIFTAGPPTLAMDISVATAGTPFNSYWSVSRPKQPWINTIGATIAATQDSLTLPFQMPANTTFLFQYSLTGDSTASVKAAVVVLSNGLHFTKVLTTNGGISTTASYVFPTVAGTSTYIYSDYYIYYDGTGTVNAPPTIMLSPTGFVAPTNNIGCTMITVIDSSLSPDVNPPTLSSDVKTIPYTDTFVAKERARRCAVCGVQVRRGRLCGPCQANEDQKDEESEEEKANRTETSEGIGSIGQRLKAVEIETKTPTDEYERIDVQVAPPSKRKVSIRIPLNGNQGSHTNTDDVDCAKEEPPSVNPCGLAVKGSFYREETSRRMITEKWIHPASGMSKLNCDGKCIWFWATPPGMFGKKSRMRYMLRTIEVDNGGVWTKDKIRRINCFCRFNTFCTHEPVDSCPEYSYVHAPARNFVTPPQDHLDEPQINGNNGEATNQDDLDLIICNSKPCGRPTHYHRKRRDGGAATPPSGAAQRIARIKSRDGEKCVDEKGGSYLVIECPRGGANHYHHETKKGDPDVDGDLELVEQMGVRGAGRVLTIEHGGVRLDGEEEDDGDELDEKHNLADEDVTPSREAEEIPSFKSKDVDRVFAECKAKHLESIQRLRADRDRVRAELKESGMKVIIPKNGDKDCNKGEYCRNVDCSFRHPPPSIPLLPLIPPPPLPIPAPFVTCDKVNCLCIQCLNYFPDRIVNSVGQPRGGPNRGKRFAYNEREWVPNPNDPEDGEFINLRYVDCVETDQYRKRWLQLCDEYDDPADEDRGASITRRTHVRRRANRLGRVKRGEVRKEAPTVFLGVFDRNRGGGGMYVPLDQPPIAVPEPPDAPVGMMLGPHVNLRLNLVKKVLYMTTDGRGLKWYQTLYVKVMSKMPLMHDRKIKFIDQADKPVKTHRQSNPWFVFACTQDGGVGDGPEYGTHGPDHVNRDFIPREYTSVIDVDVFADLIEWLNDTTVKNVQDLHTRKIVMEENADHWKIQTTLFQAISQVMFTSFNQPPREHSHYKDCDQIAFFHSMVYVAQRILIQHLSISELVPTRITPIFPKRPP